MHSVIRKRQGLPYVPEEPKGLVANSSHLSVVAVRAGPFPTDDLGQAFALWSHPKVVTQCTSPDTELRRKALAHACEQLRYARETASYLPAGIVTALNQSAQSTDAETRTLATAALARLSLEGNGREHMLSEGASASVPVLLRIVTDDDPRVRANALTAIVRIAKSSVPGARALMEGGAVALLVGRLSEEELQGELLGAVLAALEAIMMAVSGGLTQAIEGGAIGLIGRLLGEDIALSAAEHACYCLATLTVGGAEKLTAMNCGVLPPLLTRLSAAHAPPEGSEEAIERVATAAAAALMSLTVDTSVKAEATRLGAVRVLSPLLSAGVDLEASEGLDHANATLTVNALKCATNIAEDPQARKRLTKMALASLKSLQGSSEAHVQKHATIATAKVEWRP